MAVVLPFSVETARVTEELGRRTNMASKCRCQEMLALGNIEDYCGSTLTFRRLLLPLI